MQVRRYIMVLIRRKWVIVLTAVVTVAMAGLVSSLMTPVYATKATVRLATGVLGQVQYSDYLYAERLMNTYAQIITSYPVQGEVKARLGIDVFPRVSAEVVRDTELIRITAEGPDPAVAQAVANALAEAIKTESADLRTGMRANAITVIEPAWLPSVPSKPNLKTNVMLGLLAGVASGLGLAFLFENMDSTLYATEDVKSVTGLAILSRIPVAKSVRKNGLLTLSGNGYSPQYEAYRHLRTNVLAASSDRSLKTLIVTSADRGEGKSTIVANLALTLAKAGRKVMLVDADLRLPSLHTLLDLPNQVGLSSVLRQQVTLADAIQNGQASGLYVLTSGPQPENPTELLESSSMKGLIKQLAQEFDLVLIDTPCLLSVTDAAVIGPLADGVVLVVCRGQSRREDVRAALAQLSDVRANAIGVIVNRGEASRKYYDRQDRLA